METKMAGLVKLGMTARPSLLARWQEGRMPARVNEQIPGGAVRWEATSRFVPAEGLPAIGDR